MAKYYHGLRVTDSDNIDVTILDACHKKGFTYP